ncbi:putative leader peptide [Streptomyces sp. SID5785]
MRRVGVPHVLSPGRRVRLHTRPYIDLQRVSAALCPA